MLETLEKTIELIKTMTIMIASLSWLFSSFVPYVASLSRFSSSFVPYVASLSCLSSSFVPYVCQFIMIVMCIVQDIDVIERIKGKRKNTELNLFTELKTTTLKIDIN
jgi:hypothetical protein